MKIIFLGCQGSGKSTQAKMLADHLGLSYIDMGQTFRDKAAEGSDIGRKVKASLEAGILVEDNIAIKTLKDELSKEKYAKGYVLDGYPRNDSQLNGLESNIDIVFYIKVADKVAINRLMLRKREDDTEQLLTKRLNIYHEKTEPLLESFRQNGILTEINGEQPIEDVNTDVLKVINAKKHK